MRFAGKNAVAGKKIDIVLEYYSHHEIRGEDAFTEFQEDVTERTVTDKAVHIFGSGDGGGGPEFETIEIANRLKNVAGLTRAEYMSVSELLKKKEEECFRPSVYSGELYLELHRGTLTNQHQIKRNNRVAERTLRNLEYFTVLDASEHKKTISAERIHPLTEKLLQNQFHDIVLW